MLNNLQQNIAVNRIVGGAKIATMTTKSLSIVRYSKSACLVILGSCLSVPAYAGISDTIFPYVMLGYNYDDNLLRLSDENARFGAPRADTLRLVVLGAEIERPISRQKLKAAARITKVTFQRFDQLNYDAKDVSGTWDWQLGNHLQGSLGGTFSETLVPFNDFHTAERNLRTERGQFFAGKWRLHPEWEISAGVKKNRFDYELVSRRYLNHDLSGNDVGVDYVTHAGDTVGLLWSRSRVDNIEDVVTQRQDYRQENLRMRIFWKLGDVTNLQVSAGRAKRTHEKSSSTDSSGFNGKVLAQWSPRSMLNFNASLAKEYEPFEGAFMSYSLNKAGTFDVTWSPAAKLKVSAKQRYLQREFLGGLNNIALLAGASDKTRSSSVSANYKLRENINIDFTVTRDVRSSNTPYSTNYHSKGASLNASLQF